MATDRPELEYPMRPARAEDASSVAACVAAAYRHYVARIGMPPGPMSEDYEAVIRDFRASRSTATAATSSTHAALSRGSIVST